jgi:hypothetical protein
MMPRTAYSIVALARFPLRFSTDASSLPNMFAAGALNIVSRLSLCKLLFADRARFSHYVCHKLYGSALPIALHVPESLTSDSFYPPKEIARDTRDAALPVAQICSVLAKTTGLHPFCHFLSGPGPNVRPSESRII